MLITTVSDTEKNSNLHRWMLGFAGGVYLSWWFAVNAIMPNDYNPLGSRLAVVLFIFGLLGLSFLKIFPQKYLLILFSAAAWAITGHYFYLFHLNEGGVNWIVGSYVTISAIALGFFTLAGLLAYSVFVLFLSAVMIILIPGLVQSVFLPGLVTILLQANLALWARVRTSRKAEEQKIRALVMAENVRVRDEFISIASHELKTPLSTLNLQSQMLERDIQLGKIKIQPPENFEQPMKIFKRQLHRMIEMVNAMLDVSRISSHGLTIAVQTVDFSKLVRDSVQAIRLHGPEGTQSLQVDSKIPNQLEVRGDPARLAQVVENLLTNAAKYGNGKPIRLELYTENNEAVFKVIDQGIGIKPELTEKIFERFERAVSARNISGLGLGLYIARNIVQAHSGRIDVVTELGQGSTFTVRLPC